MREKPLKKETDTEVLARIVVGSIEQLREEMKDEFHKVDQRFEKSDQRFDGIESRLSHLEINQRETNHRLDAIERKQDGLLASLDENGTPK